MVCCVEYVWIDGNYNLRSKIRTIEKYVNNILEVPDWNFDGSSTNQAEGRDSEIILKPKSLFKMPFYLSDNLRQNYLVMCDTYKHGETGLIPCETNNRHLAHEKFLQAICEEPWYGLEQEYFIIDSATNKPLGFDETKTQGQFYCSVGSENAFGRTIAQEHLAACIKSGIKISGINAEVAPGQWEFQIGPCEGIDAGDHLWMARFLLLRIAEQNGVSIDFEPKPLKGEWNGSGCHTNYSTLNMRHGTKEKTGLDYIEEAIERLSNKHDEHMSVYGSGNEERMTGLHETSSYDEFSDGIANRGASIRRGNDTIKNKCGYFEDRRPSSNCDPYLVTSKIFETTVLNHMTEEDKKKNASRISIPPLLRQETCFGWEINSAPFPLVRQSASGDMGSGIQENPRRLGAQTPNVSHTMH